MYTKLYNRLKATRKRIHVIIYKQKKQSRNYSAISPRMLKSLADHEGVEELEANSRGVLVRCVCGREGLLSLLALRQFSYQG